MGALILTLMIFGVIGAPICGVVFLWKGMAKRNQNTHLKDDVQKHSLASLYWGIAFIVYAAITWVFLFTITVSDKGAVG